jgi:hypothetical protein
MSIDLDAATRSLVIVALAIAAARSIRGTAERTPCARAVHHEELVPA